MGDRGTGHTRAPRDTRQGGTHTPQGGKEGEGETYGTLICFREEISSNHVRSRSPEQKDEKESKKEREDKAGLRKKTDFRFVSSIVSCKCTFAADDGGALFCAEIAAPLFLINARACDKNP